MKERREGGNKESRKAGKQKSRKEELELCARMKNLNVLKAV